MKVSEKWLREWVNPKVDTATIVEQLTMAGLEVDSVDAVDIPFDQVIIAEIQSFTQHPDADRLKVCQVSRGDQMHQIVCGAPNVYEGMRAPLAIPGAVLGTGDDSFKIKKSKLRGVVSEGMLCGASELGYEDSVDGLWDLGSDAPIGILLSEYLALNDSVIDVDLTPNRGDCLSVLGLSRELSVINNIALNKPFDSIAIGVGIEAAPAVTIIAESACTRYLGRYIRGIDNKAETPQWMQEKLRRSGIRCHDPMVDVTNYVLLELGQPLHAFDADKLQGGIQIRYALDNEKLTLLDAKSVDLLSNTLVIADDSGAIAAAGVMGGLGSSISESTTTIMLESAFFTPQSIAGQARAYGLHTDASHRFERGVDPQITHLAMQRATELLLNIVGGQAGPITEAITAHHPDQQQQEAILLPRQLLELRLGQQFDIEEVSRWFELLGIVATCNADGWSLVPPSWRFDLNIAEDFIEEVARLFGYDNLPENPLPVVVNNTSVSESQVSSSDLRQQFVTLGFREAISYSFIDPPLSKSFFPDQQTSALQLQNPWSSELSEMRTSILPGLVNTARYNLNRQQLRLRLFEIGQCFRFDQQQGYYAVERVAGLISGNRHEEHWAGKSSTVDFFDIKAVLEQLVGQNECEFEQAELPYLHPGQAASLLLKGQVVGVIGAVHPALLKRLDISQSLFVFEIDFNVMANRVLPKFQPVSIYPEVRRDIAFEIDETINAQQILAVAKEKAPRILKSVKLFDVYSGANLSPGKKSIALGLIFSHSGKTLQDDEITSATNKIISHLEAIYQVVLR